MILAWVACAVALFAATLYLPLTSADSSLRRSLIKTIPLLGFAAAATLWSAPPLLIAALTLSALGDLALSRPGRAAFLYGLSAFALAHLLYILTFQAAGSGPLWEAFSHAPLAAAALILLALSTEIWLTPHTGSLAWPVRVYIALITAMGLAALGLSGLVIFGAALFIASDILLSLQLFRLAPAHPARKPTGYAVWTLYIAGQFLILMAFAQA